MARYLLLMSLLCLGAGVHSVPSSSSSSSSSSSPASTTTASSKPAWGVQRGGSTQGIPKRPKSPTRLPPTSIRRSTFVSREVEEKKDLAANAANNTDMDDGDSDNDFFKDFPTTINGSQIRQAAAKLQSYHDYLRMLSSSSGGRRDDGDDPRIVAEFVADTKLPTDVGHFRLRAYRIVEEDRQGQGDGSTDVSRSRNEFVGTEPCIIYCADKPPFGQDGAPATDVPVRVHDQCMTSEVFRSQRCDCKEQLRMALEYIQEHGGFIIYLQQEGRGIGIANKVAAYALQDAGYDTVDANVHLGLPEDCRQYGVVPSILEDMFVKSIRLMTNNPRKVTRLSKLGIDISSTIPCVVPKANPYNQRYLATKRARMSHANFDRFASPTP